VAAAPAAVCEEDDPGSPCGNLQFTLEVNLSDWNPHGLCQTGVAASRASIFIVWH
jgi:hypothetical protein